MDRLEGVESTEDRRSDEDIIWARLIQIINWENMVHINFGCMEYMGRLNLPRFGSGLKWSVLGYLWAVQTGRSSLTILGIPVWHFQTFHFGTSIYPKGPSTFSRMTFFDPWPSILAQKTAQFGSRSSTFERTFHFRVTVNFYPLEPDSSILPSQS